MDRLLLVRHGESAASAAGRCNGDPAIAVHITDRGREQAHALAVEVASEQIDLCVTSRFLRAQETADAGLIGREMVRLIDRRLDDIRYGDFEGRPEAEYRAWALQHTLGTPAPGGGESRVDVARPCLRVRATVEAPAVILTAAAPQ